MRAVSAVFAFGLWALTWIVPITFMLAMAWNCEGRTRKVFDHALGYYEDVEASTLSSAAVGRLRTCSVPRRR